MVDLLIQEDGVPEQLSPEAGKGPINIRNAAASSSRPKFRSQSLDLPRLEAGSAAVRRLNLLRSVPQSICRFE